MPVSNEGSNTNAFGIKIYYDDHVWSIKANSKVANSNDWDANLKSLFQCLDDKLENQRN